MNKKIALLFFTLFSYTFFIQAQDVNVLVEKVKQKMNVVNDYSVEAKMKTSVAFIKAPIGKVKIYFKKPDQLKLFREKGISILPKGGVSVNFFSILNTTNLSIIDAGTTIVNGTNTRIVKLLPLNENSEIIISTLYIDEKNLLIRKSSTTTRENGSFDMEMFYSDLQNLGLPNKMVFSFNVKDYKMPKGVTLDIDDDLSKEEKKKFQNKKGKIEFTYSNYIINKGIPDNIF
jgi:outer membrane lipoprotein-sorting protein